MRLLSHTFECSYCNERIQVKFDQNIFPLYPRTYERSCPKCIAHYTITQENKTFLCVSVSYQ